MSRERERVEGIISGLSKMHIRQITKIGQKGKEEPERKPDPQDTHSNRLGLK